MVNYDVYKQGEKWIGKREDGTRASVSAETQKEAYDATRDLMARNGGGELKLHGADGKIRDKNTIAPANDPRATKG
ncbi:DUF2188 domain-containing protein [Brachybacterium paraconglomeratum]|uniref:DUF2188 domain-containing protein n=1 Tax=Brachybacterium paraconglomeratum TaxID=173362 RepID=UPI00223C3F43|nr:DUF2188 domain-containing protein [Brachybacterium paraconglomeratum]MCT1436228.1 DUF2188 domain-containing protein [Brachybacterium paraconglomeratum]